MGFSTIGLSNVPDSLTGKNPIDLLNDHVAKFNAVIMSRRVPEFIETVVTWRNPNYNKDQTNIDFKI